MKYYLDTEFHEYHKQPKVLGINVGNPIPTIDLISIGIVTEPQIENKVSDKLNEPTSILHIGEYYAICKDFNVRDAWNSHQLETTQKGTKRVYWLRENVLIPIMRDLYWLYESDKYMSLSEIRKNSFTVTKEIPTTFSMFKYLITKYGKTKKDIANDIIKFTRPLEGVTLGTSPNKFYAYYADYDWVVFAQLFGKMMNLPKGYPMYCNDLKQTLDEKWMLRSDYRNPEEHPDYPKQDNEHNALADAKWNKELHAFMNKL